VAFIDFSGAPAIVAKALGPDVPPTLLPAPTR
jgi:hypothetical protein